MPKFTQKHNKALERIAAKTASVMPFVGDTPTAKEQRLARVRAPGWDAFSWFCTTYFPHIFNLGWSDDHRIMFEEVEAAIGVIADTGYRGLGKTVQMAIAYSIWKIIRGERYVIHTASDADLATERTGFIFHELTNNRRLLADFPDLKPVDEDQADFFLTNTARIRARGIKQGHRGTINKKTGKRPGLIVCDDIDSETNVGNASIGKRKMEKILQEVAGALDPAHPGRVIWLGNLVHPNYAISQFYALVLGDIRRDHPEFDPQHQKVIKTRLRAFLRFSVENPDGSSVWEEQYPTSRLADLRIQYGPTGYQREMLGIHVIEGNIFKNEWFTQYRTLPEPPKIKRVWLYSDPAWGEKGCYKAVISIAWDGFHFFVLHVWIRQTENTKFFRYLYDVYHELDRTYGAKFRASIETTYGQARLLVDFDRWASDAGLPPISHRFKRIDNRENKHLRIERTDTVIETAKILFPENQDFHTLKSQFLTYPDGYIDGPDALAGCLERFTEYDTGRNRVRVRKLRY